MAIKDLLLPEFEIEVAKTRRVLERIPAADSTWKPHPKSMDMGNLASHIVEIPDWVMAAMAPELDMAARPRTPRTIYSTNEEMVAAFDAKVEKAKAVIAGMSDENMMSDWKLKNGETVIMTISKLSLLRGFVFNHIIHHRGQASVYLRLKNVPVPAIYGPSADDPGN